MMPEILSKGAQWQGSVGSCFIQPITFAGTLQHTHFFLLIGHLIRHPLAHKVRPGPIQLAVAMRWLKPGLLLAPQLHTLDLALLLASMRCALWLPFVG